MPRDDFPASVKQVLARRVAMRCSNPSCSAATVGPQEGGPGIVNLGVACHLTAAAAGGPRYSPSMSGEARRSEANGIWLCQTCAKRIDSDESHYSVDLLLCWKAAAERRALAELGVKAATSHYPQAPGAQHAPIPRIGGLTYDAARVALQDAGWQPLLRHWSDGDSADIRYGSGPYFWDKGYYEVQHSSGTGHGFCTLVHRDIYGTRLVVVTAGEPLDGPDRSPGVWSWYLLSKGDEL